jgi:hypothetical protein
MERMIIAREWEMWCDLLPVCLKIWPKIVFWGRVSGGRSHQGMLLNVTAILYYEED